MEHVRPAAPPTIAADDGEAHRTAVGMAFVLASGVIFGFMSLLVRAASDRGIPSMEIVVVSGFVRWLGLAGTIMRSRLSPLGPRGVRVLLVARSLCGLTAFSCATYGQPWTSVASPSPRPSTGSTGMETK